MTWARFFSSIGLGRGRNRASALREHLAALGKSPVSTSNTESATILVISHDAYPAGAQRLVLNLLNEWKVRGRPRVKVICVEDGALRGEFESLFPTLFLSDFPARKSRDRALLEFCRESFQVIYSSTVANGLLLEDLRSLGVPIITHCHELQSAIERWAAGGIMTATLINSDFILGGCATVANNLRIRHNVPAERLAVVYDYINVWNADDVPAADELQSLRNELHITSSDVVVFGCGTTDWRKGPDIFLNVALKACERNAALKFIWIGGAVNPSAFEERITTSGLTNRIQFIGLKRLARRYFYLGHIFALTSREDPCPLAALEAANARLPVICFADAGDIPRVLGEESGAVVPFEDASAFTEAVIQIATDTNRRLRAGEIGFERVRQHHSTQAATTAIETVIEEITRAPNRLLRYSHGSPLVSVIVPNYNHQRYLKDRLASIAQQSFRDCEIIVLDDASTDASRSVLEPFVAGDSRARLLCNSKNSGSPFKQWRKGLAAARGKYVWIAESDDACERTFLAETVSRLERASSIVLAHTQSTMIDTESRHLGTPTGWLDDLAEGRWNTDFECDGIDEVRHFLCQKNTIPNASAVVFRNFSGIAFLVDDSMRLCADWLFWIRLLARGRYAFIAKPLNLWRQDSSNARIRTPGILEWEEGQRVLGEVAHLLSLPQNDREQMVARFRRRCVVWSGGGLQ